MKNLKELLTNKELTTGFDALLDTPGVWDRIMMTILQKMIPIGCKDVSNPMLLLLVLNFILEDLTLH